MLYELEQGGTGDAEKADFIREMALKQGMPIPEPLEDTPILSPSLMFHWRAFWDLSTDREIGMAEGPIPWSAIDRFARRYEIEDDEFDRFTYLIKSLDSVYIKHRAKTHKRAIKDAGKSNTPKPTGNREVIKHPR